MTDTYLAAFNRGVRDGIAIEDGGELSSGYTYDGTDDDAGRNLAYDHGVNVGRRGRSPRRTAL
jgi:hypothetical protein